MLDAIDTCPAPVIALVQGHALGGGAGLVATADIAIAHERAVFAFSEVKLGIIPAVISPYVLRKIGESAARRYFVTGERFDAATAMRIGLVHEVSRRSRRGAGRVLGELRTAGPRAARHAKRLVLDHPDGPETARRIAERRASEEGQAGLRAFLERGASVGAVARATRDSAARAALGGLRRRRGLPRRLDVAKRERGPGRRARLARRPAARVAVSLVVARERVTRADVVWSVARRRVRRRRPRLLLPRRWAAA